MPGMHILAPLLDPLVQRRPVLVVVPLVAAAVPQAGLVALVRRRDRIEAADRIAEMNHDRLVVLRALLPAGVEPRIVRLDERSVRVLRGEAEAFGDFQSHCSRLEAALELGAGWEKCAKYNKP